MVEVVLELKKSLLMEAKECVVFASLVLLNFGRSAGADGNSHDFGHAGGGVG
ncbi:MAG: hypothetical protein ACK55D_16950 [Synechococcaceae cyanobacterium]|jgi:hypothetical protein